MCERGRRVEGKRGGWESGLVVLDTCGGKGEVAEECDGKG